MKLYEGLTLREDEKRAARSRAPDDANDLSLMLVGRVMAPRKIPHGNVAGVFEKIWATNGTVTASPVAENTTLFQFSDLADKERVLEREPWLFDKNERHLLVLNEPQPDTTGADLEFKTTPFWIHVHGLPWKKRTEITAREIGDDIGRYLGVEKDKWGRMMGPYLRIRVAVDVTKPIKRTQALEGIAGQFPLQYEKLPQFCSYCGLMGHGRGDCSERLRAPRMERDVEHYPEFLRTGPNQSPFPKEHRRGGDIEGLNWNRETNKEVSPRGREQRTTSGAKDGEDGTITLRAAQPTQKLKNPGPLKRVDMEKPNPDWWVEALLESQRLNRMARRDMDQGAGNVNDMALATSNHGIQEKVRNMVQGVMNPIRIEELPGDNPTPDIIIDEDDQPTVDMRSDHHVADGSLGRRDEARSIHQLPIQGGSQMTMMHFSASAMIVSPKKTNNAPADPLSPFLVPVPIALDTPARRLEEQRARLERVKNQGGRGRGGGRGRRPAARKLLTDDEQTTEFATGEGSGSAKRKVKNGDDSATGNKKSKVSDPASFDGVSSSNQAETGSVAQSRQAP